MLKKLKDWLGRENPNRKTDLLVLLFAGVLLLTCGNLFFDGPGSKPSKTEGEETVVAAVFKEQSREEDLETRLAALFAKVEGAGAVQVMVTMQSGEEKVVAEEVKAEESFTTETASGGDTRQITSSSAENKIVLLENADGSTTPLVLKQAEAAVEGVVIVAEGGDDILVKDALSKAAQALLGVPAHKVEILKMK